jgi:hypothetical protein
MSIFLYPLSAPRTVWVGGGCTMSGARKHQMKQNNALVIPDFDFQFMPKRHTDSRFCCGQRGGLHLKTEL